MSKIKRVAVVGPECTGKSEVSAALAHHFRTVWVREYAREYINNLSRPYLESDLLEIARGQLRLEDEAAASANGVLFCDTNLYVIKVWSNFRFGRTDPAILELIARRQYDLYLLMNIDLPWVEDPQREHPHKREELYSIYLHEMRRQQVPFSEVSGQGYARVDAAIQAVISIMDEV